MFLSRFSASSIFADTDAVPTTLTVLAYLLACFGSEGARDTAENRDSLEDRGQIDWEQACVGLS